MKLKCAVVDDEPLALGLIASYVKKTPTLQLCGTYASAVEAMDGLAENPVDLLFLDIQMPELNGLKFSRMVPETTRIIFTTAFGQYALDGYRVNALDYLLKPISYADFAEAVGKAMKWFSLVARSEGTAGTETGGNTPESEAPAPAGNTDSRPERTDCIYVKSDYRLIQVKLDKILYVEGLKDYVKIYTTDEAKPILSLLSMKAMEEKLPADRFLRVHRSFIVQKCHIREIYKGKIAFGKKFIPVSESYKQALQDYIDHHSV